MDYGKLLSRAWQLVWQNKFLFVLGFLAALSGGGGGTISGGGGSPGGGGFTDGNFDQMPDFAGFWAQYGWIILLTMGVLLILLLLFWLLSLVGQGGLIASVHRIENGEKMALGAGFRAGTQHLGRLIGLSLLLALPGILFFVVFMVGLGAVLLPIFSGGEPRMESLGLLLACLVPLVCLLFPYGIVVTFVKPMAQRSIIIEQQGVMNGIRSGWLVLRQNISDLALLALLFLVLGFLVGIALFLMILPIAAISFLPLVLGLINGETAQTGSIIFSVVGVVVIIIIAALVNSLLRTYQSATFTLAYLQFGQKAEKVVSE